MEQLTFLAVHAHPDDEASSSGGLYRLLADQGVRTVLVTCTNGECGGSFPDGAKPDADHHDGDEVAAIRAIELNNAVKILGIDRLVRLGYCDSGMKGWPQNRRTRVLLGDAGRDVAAAKLADVLMEERPQVIMTYNEHGFYGHPDHIQANRITIAALGMIDYEPTLYFNAIPDYGIRRVAQAVGAGGPRTRRGRRGQGHRARARNPGPRRRRVPHGYARR